MGYSNVYIDGKALDNGSWRRIIGPPSHTMEVSGEAEMIFVQFIVQADTKANLITRVQSTEADFIKTGIRCQLFTDTAESPLYDWTPNDGSHEQVFSAVEWVPDESQNSYAIVMSLSVTASRYPRTGAAGNGADNAFPFTGQTTNIRITREYADDGTMSVSASGHFAATIANSGSPFTLTDIEASGLYAKFKVTGTMPTFANGMRIVVTGSTAYNGTHLVSSISGQYFITKTFYTSTETGLSGSVQVQATTSGMTNYTTARSTICQDYLGTGANGVPTTTNYRVLLSEHTVDSDENGNGIDFILCAGPQNHIDTNMANAGINVTRGFDFQLGFSEPSEWFPEAGPKPKLISATGTFSVDKNSAGDGELWNWYVVSKPAFATRVAAEAQAAVGGMKLISSMTTIDYTLNVVRFTHIYRTNWTGTLEYKREYAESTKLDFTAWSDADGYDVAQRPNRAVPKTIVITTTRLGVGKADLTPPTPTEGGYTYIEVSKDVQNIGPVQTEFSDDVWSQHDVRAFVRFRFKGGGAGGGMQLVNPRV